MQKEPSKLECLEAYIEYNKNNYSAYTKVETAKILIERERIAIRKETMLRPSHEVVLEVHLPEKVDTPRKLRNYFLKHFGIDIGIEEDNEDSYEKLFYNADLRSWMGDVWDLYENPIRICFLPKYFLDYRDYKEFEEIDLSGSYSKTWRQIVRQSDILDTTSEKIVSEALGKPIRK